MQKNEAECRSRFGLVGSDQQYEGAAMIWLITVMVDPLDYLSGMIDARPYQA